MGGGICSSSLPHSGGGGICPYPTARWGPPWGHILCGGAASQLQPTAPWGSVLLYPVGRWGRLGEYRVEHALHCPVGPRTLAGDLVVIPSRIRAAYLSGGPLFQAQSAREKKVTVTVSHGWTLPVQHLHLRPSLICSPAARGCCLEPPLSAACLPMSHRFPRRAREIWS